MNKFRFSLNALAVVIFTLAVTSLAQAQATRTWVSGVGDDANPCSRTAPCKTFAGAISKTATGGEIDALDPAGYGAVTITKSITIDGAGTHASILAAGTTGIIVNATSTSTVVIKNLSINGAGTGVFGIRVLAVGTISIEGTSISGFTNHGINMNMANGTTSSLFVKDCFIRTGNTTTSVGINIVPVSGAATVTALIDNCRLEKMLAGLKTGAGGRATISNSEVYGNSFAGILTEDAGGNAVTNIQNCVITHNGTGVQAGSGATTTRISGNIITQNSGKGLFLGGGTITSFGNNSVGGNGIADDAPNTTTPQI
jgi:hypothetical protein